MSSRYRRRVPRVSRTTAPFTLGKKSVSLQIKEEAEKAEKGREESYQRRRKELKERIEIRVKQLEEYKKSLKEVKPKEVTVKSRESSKENVKENAKIVSETKTYSNAAGEEVKVNEKTQDILGKSAKFLPPKEVFDNRNQWVKIDFDGDGAEKEDKWTVNDLRRTMKILVKRTVASPADVATVQQTTQGADVYKLPATSRDLWEGVEVVYDKNSEEVWARLREDVTPSEQIEFTEEEIARTSGVEISDNNDLGFGGY